MILDEFNRKLITCRKCTRLVEWRERAAREKRRAFHDWDYWSKPVPGFGDPSARVMVVGLAPGAHGSNRTGRMFTGDASGDFLFPELFRAGFASQPVSRSCTDGLTLNDLYITSVCRCAPPENKPTIQEQQNCMPFLIRERMAIKPRILVCLGRIAFENILKLQPAGSTPIPFFHAKFYPFQDNCWLVCSYHPSRRNTQTGLLTRDMFDQVWKIVRELLKR